METGTQIEIFSGDIGMIGWKKLEKTNLSNRVTGFKDPVLSGNFFENVSFCYPSTGHRLKGNRS